MVDAVVAVEEAIPMQVADSMRKNLQRLTFLEEVAYVKTMIIFSLKVPMAVDSEATFEDELMAVLKDASVVDLKDASVVVLKDA